MARVYNNKSKVDPKTKKPVVPKEESDRVVKYLAKVLNEDDHDPEYASLRKMFSKKSGVSEAELDAPVSEDDIRQLMLKINGPEGEKITKNVEKILSDNQLKQMGVEPELHNPELLDPKEIEEEMEEINPDSKKTQGERDDEFEQLKKRVQLEMKQNPQMAKYMESVLGQNFDEVLAKREKEIKEGKFNTFVRKQDYTDAVYKLNYERLKKMGRNPDTEFEGQEAKKIEALQKDVKKPNK
ncbi:hypothetical protein AKO1_015585 [Acrasis kona]|uniref:Uncharacterized protein n=1 Tax=Acrasis kona TaxID=1008807 RepID=A0AAW2ZGE0_9EUKA